MSGSINNHTVLRQARPLIDSLPIPAALWNRSHEACLFNQRARDFLGFSESDFLRQSSLWIDHVHPDDRDEFLSAWRSVEQGAASASCHYRFLPGGLRQRVGVHELLYSYGSPQTIWSVYAQEAHGDGEALDGCAMRRLAGGLEHEIGNRLQMIRGEVDLLSLSGTLPRPSAETIYLGVEEIGVLTGELKEFLTPPALAQPFEACSAVIREQVGGIAPRFEKLGIHISVKPEPELPEALVGPYFRDSLRRVIEVSGALLCQGGELIIKARLKRVAESSSMLDVRVVNQAVATLDLEEADIFCPYVKVNQHRLGLTLAIARQTLRRHQGELLFQKTHGHRGVFSMLVRLPAERRDCESIHG